MLKVNRWFFLRLWE